jgi:hypothetical protein
MLCNNQFRQEYKKDQTEIQVSKPNIWDLKREIRCLPFRFSNIENNPVRVKEKHAFIHRGNICDQVIRIFKGNCPD